MCELNPSSACELGRKEYWEEFYATELDNFEEFKDVGEIWFGRKNLERIISWLLDHKVAFSQPILDVGCGNGMTLVSLGTAGFKDLTGVDYAEEAILLARKIALEKDVRINFYALDFLDNTSENSDDCSLKTFHIIIDKGTYDAICLDTENAEQKRMQYVKQILHLLSPAGYFILFSCNFTKEELLLHFKDFSVHDEIQVPSIGFGGKTGQTVTALVLKKTPSVNETTKSNQQENA